MSGASIADFGGVLGDVGIDRCSRLLLSASSFVACTDVRASDSREPLCGFTLFLFSPAPNNPPNVFPLPNDFTDSRSGLLVGLSFFRDPDVNTPLILEPGEIPRLFSEAPGSGAPRDDSLF